jgi:ornithine decarboxylase
MEKFKLAYSRNAYAALNPQTSREIVDVRDTNFVDVAAAVITSEDLDYLNEHPMVKALGIPVFLLTMDGEKLSGEEIKCAYNVFDLDPLNRAMYDTQVECAASKYEEAAVPPYAKAFMNFTDLGYSSFDCPGHAGGQYFLKHPAGYAFYNYFGERVFKADLSCGTPGMGDLLTHSGVALEAERHAARVFNADKTYFVLSGTSGSNKIVLNSILAPGDIVLYDRNNHKSVSHGALIEAGATPVYLETVRNAYGSIGGIPDRCLDEKYIRKLIAERDPKKAKEKRPIRLAVLEVATYDGSMYNVKHVVDKIGHLCDYIFFDSAWAGYEQFIPMMRRCSPLLLDLGPEDPGIFVTQSVHKQQAGFSSASQIHKKDSHIKGQARYVTHKRVNNCFMMHTSTSPLHLLVASLDINARMQEGEAGRLLWHEAIKTTIDARKKILKNCHYFRPFVPPVVNGKKWEDGDTEQMANDIAYWTFEPDAAWHGFKGYGKDEYYLDPCKLMLLTSGINMETGEYEDFGISGTIVMAYLRDNQIIPEKCDLNDILFLVTPADTPSKLDDLVAKLMKFEELVDKDAPMYEVLPDIYYENEEYYKGYTIRQLCQEMHDFYKKRKINVLLRHLFQKEYFPEYVTLPQHANYELVRGHGELVRLEDIEGRIALEGGLPYPPGILCIQPGERWSKTVRDYFLALTEGMNDLPGFTPSIQGVYFQKENDNKIHGYAYVLKKEFE